MSGNSPNGNGHGKDGPKTPGKEALRAQLPKRFYKEVSVAVVPLEGAPPAAGTLHQILLDGRAMRTPKKRALALPAAALAEAIAEEWRAQRESIDPATMPMTRIANSAIDAVTDHAEDVAADIAAFAASDLLCYRAEAPHELAGRQAQAWNPVIGWAEEALGTRFALAKGVMPVEQMPTVRESVLRQLAGAGPLRLACLHVITTLTGSALLALAQEAGRLSADEAWALAHIDEDWQIEQWGEDAEAAARRAFRRREHQAASRMLGLAAAATLR